MARWRIVGFGLSLVIVGSACGLRSLGGAGALATAAPTQVPLPVSINQGLASLDSYRMTFTTDIFDSVTQQRTASTFVAARDRKSDASYSRNETQVSTAEDEAVSEDVVEQFVVGHQVCQVSDGEAELTTLSDTAQVMSDLMTQVVDFHPLIENPVYVGDDVVNGVPVHTYTFELRSVGAASDVEADRAEGTYAVAVDGDYIVRYRLDLELRTGAEGDPEAQSTVSSFEVSLEDINQPVAITPPPACQAAAPTGE